MNRSRSVGKASTSVRTEPVKIIAWRLNGAEGDGRTSSERPSSNSAEALVARTGGGSTGGAAGDRREGDTSADGDTDSNGDADADGDIIGEKVAVAQAVVDSFA